MSSVPRTLRRMSRKLYWERSGDDDSLLLWTVIADGAMSDDERLRRLSVRLLMCEVEEREELIEKLIEVVVVLAWNPELFNRKEIKC
jgi:hypothetical protein